ncbi:MAG: hypothetical protein AAB410_03945 [Patescibacteria group bacterium]
MKKILSISLILSLFLAFTPLADASHSWGPYHWARKINPFTLKLGDNVSSSWDAYLAAASADWTGSSVLDTTIVAGNNTRNCKPTLGRIEVCNKTYGNNGWLGLAQIWINSSNHITRGITKVNDTYFNNAPYNTPAWKQFVMCQEIGHNFGLDHQDEDFYNPNLGSCMDYTNNPAGNGTSTPNNLHPNAHDFAQLEAIYAHLDGSTTVGASAVPRNYNPSSGEERAEWGKALRQDGRRRNSVFEKDLGKGSKVITHVFWVE